MEPRAVTVEDVRIIERQIGRPPRGVLGIARRCSFGYPQVIRVAPVVDGKPFPTGAWLTCPFLVSAIGRLEAAGWVGQLEEAMAADPALADAMDRAHERAVAERRALLTDADRRALRANGIGALEKGIGGIADRRRLKCLHLHAAAALAAAGGNPVGDRVLGLLAARECSRNQVICSAL